MTNTAAAQYLPGLLVNTVSVVVRPMMPTLVLLLGSSTIVKFCRRVSHHDTIHQVQSVQ